MDYTDSGLTISVDGFGGLDGVELGFFSFKDIAKKVSAAIPSGVKKRLPTNAAGGVFAKFRARLPGFNGIEGVGGFEGLEGPRLTNAIKNNKQIGKAQQARVAANTKVLNKVTAAVKTGKIAAPTAVKAPMARPAIKAPAFAKPGMRVMPTKPGVVAKAPALKTPMQKVVAVAQTAAKNVVAAKVQVGRSKIVDNHLTAAKKLQDQAKKIAKVAPAAARKMEAEAKQRLTMANAAASEPVEVKLPESFHLSPAVIATLGYGTGTLGGLDGNLGSIFDSIKKGLAKLDPTNKDSAIRAGLRKLDPTSSTSIIREKLRAIDPTNKTPAAQPTPAPVSSSIPSIVQPVQSQSSVTAAVQQMQQQMQQQAAGGGMSTMVKMGLAAVAVGGIAYVAMNRR